MSDIALTAENLSKIYQIGVKNDRLFRDKLLKLFSGQAETNEHIALNNISFELNRGEALGMVGRNGAGKSTLLKVISKITPPTRGKLEIWGRVASLLEVGTGFHQELTGRDNIFLSGTVMGMKKAEIRKRFDEIVDFSGVEKFLETPVKRYSSGMYVRLAFSVAAHLESDILLIDEVLAVGDAEFQKKCLGKMQDVTAKNGRTVIFVSHNMQVIKQLCTKAVYLHKGCLQYFGDTDAAISMYLKNENNNKLHYFDPGSIKEDIDLVFNNIFISQQGTITSTFQNSYPIEVEINYTLKNKIIGLQIGFDVLDLNYQRIFRTFSFENTLSYQDNSPPTLLAGTYTSKAVIPSDYLISGSLYLNITASVFGKRTIEPSEGIEFKIDIVETGTYLRSIYNSAYQGMITLPVSWETIRHTS